MTIIDIKGVIVSDEDKPVYDYLGFESTCPDDVKNALKESEDNDVTVYINSGGGDLSAGNEIYYLLKSSEKNITIDIINAGSAASVIAMARHSRIIPSGVLMIHNVLCMGYGNHKEHEDIAEILKVHDKAVAQAYIDKTGMDMATLLELMEKETYLTSAECIAYGFVDEVINEGVKVAASGTPMIAQSVMDKLRVLARDEKAPSVAQRATAPPEGEPRNGSERQRNKNKLEIMRMKGERAKGQPP